MNVGLYYSYLNNEESECWCT